MTRRARLKPAAFNAPPPQAAWPIVNLSGISGSWVSWYSRANSSNFCSISWRVIGVIVTYLQHDHSQEFTYVVSPLTSNVSRSLESERREGAIRYMLVELVKDATGALVIPGGNRPFTASAVENQHIERCISPALTPNQQWL